MNEQHETIKAYFGIVDEGDIVEVADLEEQEESLCQVPMKLSWDPEENL